MATSSHGQSGVTFNFNGSTIGQIFDLKWDYGQGMPTARQFLWKEEMGSVTVGSFGFISTGLWGTRGMLTITGGGMGFTNMAVCTAVSATAQVNGVTKYSATFKLVPT